MAEGEISELRSTYGFIKPQGGGRRVFFHKSTLQDVQFNELKVGEAVEYEAEEGEKGPRATVVRLSAGVTETEDCFLNPYNFVRYLDKPRSQGHVLGDCPPPPHDRYVGLTGHIVCELKAETPLFVSDSHAVKGKSGEHRTFRLFQVENEAGELEPALPATSLRGMVRSVFEAATNSCFAVFEGSRRLEYREKPEYGNKVKSGAGIVNALPKPAENGQSATNGEIVLCYVAKVGAYYEGREQWKNVLDQKPNGQPWQCGDWTVARAKRFRQGYVVRELSISRERLQPLSDDEEYIEGWLKLTGKGEGTSKRSEFLFLNPDRHGSRGMVRFSLREMDEYNTILVGQQERNDLPVPPQSPQLALGDLIWVETKGKGNNLRARRVVRVQIPRIPYGHTVQDLLPNHLHHCSNYDALCPACRVFGWVHENAAELGKKERVAYAGRVRFSHGRLIHSAGTVDDPTRGITLAILSTPKPTTTQFYLLKNGQPDSQVTYDDKEQGAHLRGRKVYRHHGAEPSQHDEGYEYERPSDEEHDSKDDQNRTVCGVLKAGTIFQFDVDFENLAPEELGGLLWSLELEEGMHHRLGYAKPLGFGSVSVKVKAVQILQPHQRFRSLKGNGWETVTEAQWRQWVKHSKTQIADIYGEGAPFAELPNIQDLKALTSEPDIAAIHYPRLEAVPQPEGENFRWFVANKKRSHPHPLGMAADDTGLPLDPEA